MLPAKLFQSVNLWFRALTFKDDESLIEEIHKKTKPSQTNDKVKKNLEKGNEDYKETNGLIMYKGLIYVPNPHQTPWTTQDHGAHHQRLLMAHNVWADCKVLPGVHQMSGKETESQCPHSPFTSTWQQTSLQTLGKSFNGVHWPSTRTEGYKMIMVMVCMLPKDCVLIPCSKEISSEGTTHLCFDKVVPRKGLFWKVVSNRGPQFVGPFIKVLYELLKIKQNPSTAYHPQTDGQTKCINQEVEKYLQMFTNEQQMDWADWLPMAEFALNNCINQVTGYLPFFSNHG